MAVLENLRFYNISARKAAVSDILVENPTHYRTKQELELGRHQAPVFGLGRKWNYSNYG